MVVVGEGGGVNVIRHRCIVGYMPLLLLRARILNAPYQKAYRYISLLENELMSPRGTYGRPRIYYSPNL